MIKSSKTIIWVLRCSLVIHAIYLALFLFLIMTQNFYLGLFWGQNYQFVFPVASFFLTLVRFGLHCALGMRIVRQIRKGDMKRITEIIGLIYFSFGFVLGYRTGDILTKLSIRTLHISPQYMAFYNSLGIFLSWIVFLLNIAMFLFLIGCAMSWCYKKCSFMEHASEIHVNEVIK